MAKSIEAISGKEFVELLTKAVKKHNVTVSNPVRKSKFKTNNSGFKKSVQRADRKAGLK